MNLQNSLNNFINELNQIRNNNNGLKLSKFPNNKSHVTIFKICFNPKIPTFDSSKWQTIPIGKYIVVNDVIGKPIKTNKSSVLNFQNVWLPSYFTKLVLPIGSHTKCVTCQFRAVNLLRPELLQWKFIG